MAKFDVELDYKGIKAVTSVKTRVSVKTAKLFKSHPASHVKLLMSCREMSILLQILTIGSSDYILIEQTHNLSLIE